MRFLSTIAVISILAVAGQNCARKPAHTPELPPTQPPPPVEIVPPLESEPPPTEAELAAAAGGRAESYGMFAQAALEYERAAQLATGPSPRAEAQWSLAQLWADPRNPGRDLEKARLACVAAQEAGPSAARQRETRVLLALLVELSETRAAAAGFKSDLDASRASEAALKDELKKKDQELENIKKVLLEKKP